jgi:SAM-dependent methyltransferase
MTDLSALAEASFDAVIQPVSTCYVPDVHVVYREVARVLRPGGVYASQHKQPVSLQATSGPTGAQNHFVITGPYRRADPLPPAGDGCWHREAGALEHLHPLEDLLGGLCRAGFVIEQVAEPRHDSPDAPVGTFAYRCRFVPPYLALKARRSEMPSVEPPGHGLIVA